MTLLFSPQPVVWQFDDFVLDIRRYELRCNGIAVPMEPQVFDVMTQLVSNHQRMVTKNELFETVWGGRFVGEAALTSRIKAARRALGDDGQAQRYIRTVRSRGYQFVGTIVDADQQSQVTPAQLPGRLVVGAGATRPRLRRFSNRPGGRSRLAGSARPKALSGPPR